MKRPFFNPVKLIEEVRSRPALYSAEQPADREEKLALWKEVGAAICGDWPQLSKALAYDRVLYIQRKWRSLRDAYNRELRARRSGVRVNRRVYIYFRRMSFLGGFEGTLSDVEQDEGDFIFDAQDGDEISAEPEEPVRKKRRKKKKKTKMSSSDSEPPPPEETETEMTMFPVEIPEGESDSDRLFLLSFLPEMRQLPLNVKMWARTQIAKVMQDAVECHFSNVHPEHLDKGGIRREILDTEGPLN